MSEIDRVEPFRPLPPLKDRDSSANRKPRPPENKKQQPAPDEADDERSGIDDYA